jgi:hypothetical protein
MARGTRCAHALEEFQTIRTAPQSLPYALRLYSRLLQCARNFVPNIYRFTRSNSGGDIHRPYLLDVQEHEPAPLPARRNWRHKEASGHVAKEATTAQALRRFLHHAREDTSRSRFAPRASPSQAACLDRWCL